jgi:hypothetical protein
MFALSCHRSAIWLAEIGEPHLHPRMPAERGGPVRYQLGVVAMQALHDAYVLRAQTDLAAGPPVTARSSLSSPPT